MLSASKSKVFSKNKHKHQNNNNQNQNNGNHSNYLLTQESSRRHLMPQSSSYGSNLNRPNSEEFNDNHMISDSLHTLSLPNLDQLTDEDINLQFESMLVSLIEYLILI